MTDDEWETDPDHIAPPDSKGTGAGVIENPFEQNRRYSQEVIAQKQAASVAARLARQRSWSSKDVHASAYRGIHILYLLGFAEAVDPMSTTKEVVEKIIKPRTLANKCRFADQLLKTNQKAAVGRATVFGSHCWNGRFRDLVAALAHVLPNDAYVWLDIFAVNQHRGTAEQNEDLDVFVPVVQSCRALVLCAAHLESVASLSQSDITVEGITAVALPEADRELCAFFRCWCLVELGAALARAIPVVMLIGYREQGWGGAFLPNMGMVESMAQLVDVETASATVESDRERILTEKLPELLGADRGEAATELNSLAVGALRGAQACMNERELLQAVMGDSSPMMALDEKAKESCFRAAAAAGFVEPLKTLLRSGMPVDAPSPKKRKTALHMAARGGHVGCIQILLDSKADTNLRQKGGEDALQLAATGGFAAAVRLLMPGADPARLHTALTTAIWDAPRPMVGSTVAALIEGRADVNLVGSQPPLFVAVIKGQDATCKLLIKAGADINRAVTGSPSGLLDVALKTHGEAFLASILSVVEPMRIHPTQERQLAESRRQLAKELKRKEAEERERAEAKAKKEAEAKVKWEAEATEAEAAARRAAAERAAAEKAKKAQEIYRAGLEANRRGDTRDARDLFLQAHALMPADVRFLLSAANMHLKLGETKEAKDHYTTLEAMPLTLRQAEMVRAKRAELFSFKLFDF